MTCLRELRSSTLTVAFLLAFTVLLTACVSGIDWSPSDKSNARYIGRSLAEARRAAALANALPADFDPGDPKAGEVRNWLNRAYATATLVRDDILAKAHPELPQRFRNQYEPSLTRLLHYYRTGKPPGDPDPARALSDFYTWFVEHQPDFRWWDDYSPLDETLPPPSAE
ncbi:MAG: hypothetical protein PVJ40_06000 [Gammaproteobacteria bacterium]|jgi:hypothetical protein